MPIASTYDYTRCMTTETTTPVEVITKQLACGDCHDELIVAKLVTPEVMDSNSYANDLSAFFCHHCKEHMGKTEQQELTTDCYTVCFCGEKSSIYTTGLKVLPEAVPFLQPDTIKETEWFHATRVEDWLHLIQSSPQRPYVHAGTKAAALQLAADQYFNGNPEHDEDIFLWKLTINPNAVIAEDIVDDESRWNRTVQKCSREHLGGDIQRYLNRWESSGSISLLLDPLTISSATMSHIRREDCASYIK